jgi:hypothetical protein
MAISIIAPHGRLHALHQRSNHSPLIVAKGIPVGTVTGFDIIPAYWGIASIYLQLKGQEIDMGISTYTAGR